MALTTGAQPRATTATQPSGLAPYYERLEPIAGGYNLAREDGRPVGQLRVFDDRAACDVIHAQFCVGRGPRTKVATMHFDTIEGYDELIDALSQAREQLRANGRKA